MKNFPLLAWYTCTCLRPKRQSPSLRGSPSTLVTSVLFTFSKARRERLAPQPQGLGLFFHLCEKFREVSVVQIDGISNPIGFMYVNICTYLYVVHRPHFQNEHFLLYFSFSVQVFLQTFLLKKIKRFTEKNSKKKK